MDPNVVDYDLFVNESEIFAQDKSKEEKVEEFVIIPSSMSKNEKNMRLIPKKLHE
jgi:hypothetical protein